MAKKMQLTEEDDALLAELGIEVEEHKPTNLSPREERIIAGFEDIERFYEQHRRLPTNDDNKDIFERLYAVRLETIRASDECCAVLASFDQYGLLQGQPEETDGVFDDLDDDALLAELGILDEDDNDITILNHVKPRAEIRAKAEEIAQRVPCRDFETFKPLFAQISRDLKTGMRTTRPFKKEASIEQGFYFIVGGQIAYVAEVAELEKDKFSKLDGRLRVIYDNGTESNILYRSLQRALYKDDAGRRITEPSAGPLFSDVAEDGDIASGTIYVLRSQSAHPLIQAHREVIHKIGVTSGEVEKRIASAKLDPTFLMADVEVVATYTLANINRTKLEQLLHTFFEPARFDIEIADRFGQPVRPREWYLIPLDCIQQAIEYLQAGTLVHKQYDPLTATLRQR
jgi:hypothetical protein